MKISFFFVFLFFVSTALKAQDKAERDVEAIVGIFNKVMVSPDEKILDELVSDQLSYGHSSGLVQDKATFIDDLVNGPFDFLTADVSEQTITVSGNVAVVRHIFASSFKNEGVSGNLKIGIMMVWHKEKGKWKLLARQAFKL